MPVVSAAVIDSAAAALQHQLAAGVEGGVYLICVIACAFQCRYILTQHHGRRGNNQCPLFTHCGSADCSAATQTAQPPSAAQPSRQ
jgi:hypothetical protein